MSALTCTARSVFRRVRMAPMTQQFKLCTSRSTQKELNESQTVVGLKVHKDQYPEAVLKALSEENASQRELNRIRKTRMIEQFRRNDQDTGSPEVQIAVLSDRILNLTEHVKQHRQDKHNIRRLVLMVSKRRSQMQYLLRKDPQRYMRVVKELGLRPSSVFSKDVSLGAKKAPRPTLH